jgi:hypothetical protein
MSFVAHHISRARRTKCGRKISSIDGGLGGVRRVHDGASRAHRRQSL